MESFRSKSYVTSTKFNITFVYTSYLEDDLAKKAVIRFGRSMCFPSLFEVQFLLHVFVPHNSSERKDNPKLKFDTFFVVINEGKAEAVRV